MPYRQHPLVVHETYHVFNRSIAKEPIFIRTRDHQRALELLKFYSFKKPRLRYSHYNRLQSVQKQQFWEQIENNNPKQVKILAFCLMPNHFHLLLQEIEEGGISRFLSNFQNSYAKYFNTRNNRSGSLFQSMFKAIRVETDEQLVHVCRYIHLNPLTSYLIKNSEELEKYSWSSYVDFISSRSPSLVDPSHILSYFSSLEHFKSFTLDQKDYQRELNLIRHLSLE